MSLMDQLNAEEDMNMVPCCNELNAGEMPFSPRLFGGMPCKGFEHGTAWAALHVTCAIRHWWLTAWSQITPRT